MINLFTDTWQSLWGGAIPEDGVGAVYTRPEIVSLILDLAQYDSSTSDLSTLKVLEPSCGSGAFVGQIVERMVAAHARCRGRIDWASPDFDSALRAVDINPVAIERVRADVAQSLETQGCPEERAIELVNSWIWQTDFLLHDWDDERFDFVIGNPPYVRIEELPKAVLQEYRRRSATSRERADIYISFIEKGLELLGEKGQLGYICANRFAKNRYGERLRNLISRNYHVRWYLNLEHTQPFEEEVSAYPAIIVLDRNKGEPTLAATIQDISQSTLDKIRTEEEDGLISHFDEWYHNGSPWIATRSHEALELGDIEKKYPLLEDSAVSTRVGIGVATGADDVFVLSGKNELIEESFQLPLLLSRHISVQEIDWTGEHVLNPFDPSEPDGLVNLQENPGIAAYLSTHEVRIRNRYVARQRPRKWYRTIDRIHPSLVGTEKLVIPDIQPGGVIGYDQGNFYPHHNVYYITSSGWDLRALQALLRSTFVCRQITAHSVQMRGGSLRYQAGTLRKIRIPHAESISKKDHRRLREHAIDQKTDAIDAIVDHILLHQSV